jgi:hypothetical protein
VRKPEISVSQRITEVTVSALPAEHVNYDLYSVKVQWRGGETYAVKRLGQVLDVDGEWDYEPNPSNRDDEWIAAHRFSYEEAVRLATKAAVEKANHYLAAIRPNLDGAR